MADDLLFGSEPLTPAHTDRLRRAFSDASKRAWCYYAPFLCCYSLPPGREVFLVERGGALWLPVRRTTSEGPQIDLLVPPLPFPGDAFDSILDDLMAVNGDRPFRILWVDEEDARRLPADRFTLRLKDAEYLYDPARVVAAPGRPYRDLRKRLRRFQRRVCAHFREMEEGDIPACEDLLRHWRRRQGRRRAFLLDWGYTRAALARYGEFSREDLQGWCVRVEGRVAAFAMGGRMQDGLASFFIAKTDPEVRGLSEYLRWEVCRSLSDYRLVNDAGDLNLAGLRQHKRKFRPVGRLPVYAAEVRPEAGR